MDLLGVAGVAGGGVGTLITVITMIGDYLKASNERKKAEAERDRAAIDAAQGKVQDHIQKLNQVNEIELEGSHSKTINVGFKDGIQYSNKGHFKKEEVVWTPAALSLALSLFVIVVFVCSCVFYVTVLWSANPSQEITAFIPDGKERIFKFLFIEVPLGRITQGVTAGGGLLSILSVLVFSISTLVTTMAGRIVRR